MQTVIFYAKQGKQEQKVKKLLKRWDVDFDFIEIQEGNPVIQIAGVLHEWPEFDRQEKLFKLIENAIEQKKQQELKKKLKIPNKCIIHGFRGNARLAQQLIHENFYLSFGEKIIYHPETVLATPLNRIFTETDTSSCGIKEVYDIVGRIKQIEIKELKEYIEKNIHECFPTLVF